jgi:hypothetical protein
MSTPTSSLPVDSQRTSSRGHAARLIFLWCRLTQHFSCNCHYMFRSLDFHQVRCSYTYVCTVLDFLWQLSHWCPASFRVRPRDVQKTAITIPFAAFEFPFIFFGRPDVSALRGRRAAGTRLLFRLLEWDPHFLVVTRGARATCTGSLRSASEVSNSNQQAKCVFRAFEVTFFG